ncbi:hypothetical protein AC629_36400 [Bradyrhizobium sp. NAS80.1]|uniref:hypothetical protein n=1 Tax=Bradyrhizobium sp. NAS80.1 TaxID=1680159 RepID=UPI0009602B11|nr:hypothetical protein [Bradyrhizobium sp. NAS80.1]OKO73747.1 hypothetical protein AC629_36400 [Bradyrhizobium sp. NAS80.1]
MLDRPPHRSTSPGATRAQLARARRKARYRQRQRDGKMTAQIEFDSQVVDLLVRTGWLPPREVHDRREISEAIERMLADAAAHR